MGGLDMVVLHTTHRLCVYGACQWAHCRLGRRIPETTPLVVIVVVEVQGDA